MLFLDQERDKEANKALLFLTRKVIVESAVQECVIKDDDLAMIPESIPILTKLADVSRDDIYNNAPETGIQFPMIQRFFCYNFAKGIESVFLWDQSPDGDFNFDYKVEDAVNGLVGAQVDNKFQYLINIAIPKMQNVFL